MDSLTELNEFAKHNKHVQESLHIIEESLSKYKPDEICISYNGGKDCTTILHMVHSIAKKVTVTNCNDKLLAFYAQLPNHFEEEYKFVHEVSREYNLELMLYASNSLKDSLFKLKADAPNIKAIFVGTRKDDLRSGGSTEVVAETDDDWPKFIRINPIMNWSYAQVWDFIRALNVPYCDLYNQGYSSLGTKSDTVKNSSLLMFDENGQQYYLPAWSLIKSQEERSHRSFSLEAINKTSELR